jgi:hypothetical protein
MIGCRELDIVQRTVVTAKKRGERLYDESDENFI